jgi:hypothetical protein
MAKKPQAEPPRVPMIAGSTLYYDRLYASGEMVLMPPSDAADYKALCLVRDPTPDELRVSQAQSRRVRGL